MNLTDCAFAELGSHLPLDSFDKKSNFRESDSYINSSSIRISDISLIPIAIVILLIVSLAPLIYFLIKRIVFPLVKYPLTVSVQVTGSFGNSYCSDDNRVYHSLLKWLGRRKNVKEFQTETILIKTINHDTTESDMDSDDDEEVARPPPGYQWAYNLSQTAGYGINYFKYQGKWIQLTRRIITPKATINDVTHEILTLTAARWNRYLLHEILEKAKPKATKIKETTMVIYKANVQSECWVVLGGPKKKRPLNTLILDGNVAQKLVKDIKDFLTLEDWYVERGIPYRRGYLLYGPPGCGKSSVIKSIAGEIGYDICMFSLSQKLTDDSMSELLNSAPTKSIILLEDIDAAFKSREDENASSRETNLAFEGCGQSSLTFRGLLNALDGVGSNENGQIVFMTTNYPDRLDPALIRPGRVDLKQCIGYPEDFQVEGMFKRFYPDTTDELKSLFLKSIRSLDLKISMAMLQGLMLVYREDPQGAIDNAKEHFETQFTNTNFSKDACNGLYC